MKPEPKKEIYGTIIVEVEKYLHKYLPLHERMAHGETPSGEKYEVELCIHSGSMLLLFPDKPAERYFIPIQNVIFKALDLRERKKSCQTSSYPEVGVNGAISGFDIPLQTNFPEPERY